LPHFSRGVFNPWRIDFFIPEIEDKLIVSFGAFKSPPTDIEISFSYL